jgi:hypothetical protein
MALIRTVLGAMLLACLLVASSARSARAQEASDTSQAADLRRRGNEAMDARRFGEALALYRQAHSLSQDAALLYNQGRALEGLGRYAEALAQLEKFDAEAAPALKARVPGLARMLAEVRSHVAFVDVKSNVAGAHVNMQGNDVGTTPLATTLKLDPGRATLEIVAEGYEPYRREIDLEGGRTVVIDATLLPKPVPVSPPSQAAPVTAAPAESRAITSQWWFWTGAGVLVVGGGVLAAALLVNRPADRGDIPPGRVPVSLVHF